ncbi:hypothetical protein BLAT2472_50200 [Burkholderia latens]
MRRGIPGARVTAYRAGKVRIFGIGCLLGAVQCAPAREIAVVPTANGFLSLCSYTANLAAIAGTVLPVHAYRTAQTSDGMPWPACRRTVAKLRQIER